MLLLYPREILILDLELSQTVGVVAIERSGVPFIQVCVTRKCDPRFLRQIIDTVCPGLVSRFNKCLKSGSIPDDLKMKN